MNREQERVRKNLEKNPVAECNKIQKKSRKFNDEQIVENLYSFLGEKKGYEVNLPFTTDQAVPELLFPLLRVTLKQVRISQINGQKGI